MILDRRGNPIQIEKKHLSSEWATFQSATGSSYDILPDPDPILWERGDDAEVLDALAADDQVTMAMQLRRRKVTNKGNYDYSPGQPDKGENASKNALALCDWLTMDLSGIKLKTVFNAILSANFYGYSVIELYWGVDGNRMRLTGMEEKPREWFGFDGEGTLFFYDSGGLQTPVPYGKFLLIRHEPTYKNPYGLRLLSRCLWPVAFKRSGIDWCMKFLERYGMPWQVAKAPSDYDTGKRATLAGSLAAMVQDAVAVLPFGAEHQIVSADAKSGAETYINFLNFWNSAISKVLSCQTQSSEITGSTGTYASSKTHYEVLGDVTEADEQLVCDAMNDLAIIYATVNGSAEYPPVFSFREAEDHMAQAELDEKRYAVGVRFTKAHFERQGLTKDEFELMDETMKSKDQSGEQNSTLSPSTESDAFAQEEDPHQDALDDHIADVLPDFIKSNGATLDMIQTAIKEAETPEDLQDRLLGIAGRDLEEDDLFTLIETALTEGEMFGRYAVNDEAAGDGGKG